MLKVLEKLSHRVTITLQGGGFDCKVLQSA